MGVLNGYLNEQIEAKKAKALFAIATAIEKLADAIRERPIVVPQSVSPKESEAAI